MRYLCCIRTWLDCKSSALCLTNSPELEEGGREREEFRSGRHCEHLESRKTQTLSRYKEDPREGSSTSTNHDEHCQQLPQPCGRTREPEGKEIVRRGFEHARLSTQRQLHLFGTCSNKESRLQCSPGHYQQRQLLRTGFDRSYGR